MISCRRAAQGFTLTELAIVLGIVGIVLGVIWIAASKVYQNNRVQLAVKDTQFIVQSYRSLYTRGPADVAVNTDETCLGINSGFFPSDMLVSSATCITGNQATYPQFTWPNSYTQVIVMPAYQGFFIETINLPQSICNSYAQQLANVSDVTQENINGTIKNLPPAGTDAPFTESQIAAACQSGNLNYVLFVYNGR